MSITKTEFGYKKFIKYRKPLLHAYQKLIQDQEINIVYFGGSITNGHGCSNRETMSWRGKTMRWFQEHYPNVKINAINSSIGESGTYLGVYRLKRDIISQAPDLLFLEYAVNDLSHDTNEEEAAIQFETIIREIKSEYPLCDIVTVLTETRETAAGKELCGASRGHEKISEAYGIPSLHVGKALYHTVEPVTDEMWNTYFIDAVHPNDNGYALYYECLEEFLNNSLLISEEMIPMQSSKLLDGNREYVTCGKEMLKNSKGFLYSDEVYIALERTPYIGYIYTEEADAEFTYDFYGTEMGIYTNFSNYKLRGGGLVEYSVDGSAFQRAACAVHNPTLIVKDLSSKHHEIRIRPVFSQDTPNRFEVMAVFSRDAQKETKHV